MVMRYMVAVTEIVEYLVPIEADNEEDAAEMGEAAVCEAGDRDKWCVGVRARECDGVNVAKEQAA